MNNNNTYSIAFPKFSKKCKKHRYENKKSNKGTDYKQCKDCLKIKIQE